MLLKGPFCGVERKLIIDIVLSAFDAPMPLVSPLGRRLYSYIFDLPLDESEALLDEIRLHTCQDKFVWEHKWNVGDLLVWDNLCLMDYGNAFPSNLRRLMYKSITAGEAVT